MSHRLNNGQRVNQWGMNMAADGGLTATSRGRDGTNAPKDSRERRPRKPSHRFVKVGAVAGHKDGDTATRRRLRPACHRQPRQPDPLSGGWRSNGLEALPRE